MPADQPGRRPAGHRSARARLAVVIAVAAAVTLTNGCGAGRDAEPATTGPQAGRQSSPPDARAVHDLLNRRAAAIRLRDRTGFLSTVAPPHRPAQARVFEKLITLPFGEWREELHSTQPAGPAPGTPLRVTLRYRFAGHDRRPVARTRHLTVARQEDKSWAIVGDGRAHGLTDEPVIWDGDDEMHVALGSRTLVIGDGAKPAELEEIARRLDGAVPRVDRVVGHSPDLTRRGSGTDTGTGWNRRVVVLVPGDPDRARGLAGGDHDLRQIAALATVAPGPGRSAGPDRIVISPKTFGRLNSRGRQFVLTHELTHVATGGARDSRTPLWLIEGLADHVGYQGVKVSVRSAAQELRTDVLAGRLPERLPGRAEFGGSAGGLPQAYAQAWLACHMIADRYGQEALLRLYRAAGSVGEEAAVREVLGLSRAELTKAWRDHLVRELR